LPVQTVHNSQELLRLIADGDEKAFKALFDIYRKRLFFYISDFIRSEPVAEELVMDVFMKIWEGRVLATQIINFDAFLFRVARNKSIDFLRSAAKDSRLKELLWYKIQEPCPVQADTYMVVKEYEEKIREAISLLSPQRMKVYNLSREQDLAHDQIAEQLTIAKATVNNHIVEAQRFIRNYLSKNLDLTIFILVIAQL
jgi:RNA polymerase sigma-70 factor (ECF subfamily)